MESWDTKRDVKNHLVPNPPPWVGTIHWKETNTLERNKTTNFYSL